MHQEQVLGDREDPGTQREGVLYMIEGDIIYLSHTALKDLIPKTFPMIGGEEQQDDGHDRFEGDAN